MCGIAGIIDLTGRPAEASLVQRICDGLVHRGPDDGGYFAEGVTALGQRRLSIIDLASGKQPMSNEDGTVWVTFNGEIYNFHELRRRLEALGHRFATQSDTEVIVHAYEQFGERCVEQFRGMFAFAIWDGGRRRLFLARDRVGKKPLYYTEAGGQFVFASEFQAILRHPAVSRDLDPTAVDDFLTYGYVPAPKTPFRGVFKLPPAHCLSLTLGEGGGVRDLVVGRYWRLDYGPKLALDEEEAAEGLLEVLTEAVRLRLIADVPLGALLSGGIDSGLIVALMGRQSDQPVKTFSIGFEEESYNELPSAARVARLYGTEHHELIVRPDALDVVPRLVQHYGEPFADSSAIPSYYVARLTRQHVKVALNGDGGDESFGGYERYLASLLAHRYQRSPALLRRGLIDPLATLIPRTTSRGNRLGQVKRLVRSAAVPTAQRYPGWLTYLTRAMKDELYTADFRRRVGDHQSSRWLEGTLETNLGNVPDHLDALLATDIETYLPYDLLTKMDIATMAASLEARSPFLDHKVMEFAARLPGRYKVRGLTLKYLLKKLGVTLLPRGHVRRRKMGFGIPVGEWMRDELRPLLEDVLLRSRSGDLQVFRPEPLRRIVREHISGEHDHRYPLWAIFWYYMWQDLFLV
jgi:asparagine synthase (glutamine-hydrolysing)